MKHFDTIINGWKEWLSFLKNRKGYNFKLKPVPVIRINSKSKKILIASILSLFVTLSAWAHSDSRLTISAITNNDLRVEVDGRVYSLNNHSLTIARITPGYHMVRVMADGRRRFGLFGRRSEVLYSNRIYVREGYHTDITFNRFGKAIIDQRKMDRNYDDNEWWDDHDNHDRREDRRWDNNDRRYENKAMSQADFELVKNAINRERSENEKSQMARNVFGRNYMTSQQVRDICRLFRSDSYKLEFAKFAYNRTTDRQNYHVVYKVFSYKTNRKELQDFINKHH